MSSWPHGNQTPHPGDCPLFYVTLTDTALTFSWHLSPGASLGFQANVSCPSPPAWCPDWGSRHTWAHCSGPGSLNPAKTQIWFPTSTEHDTVTVYIHPVCPASAPLPLAFTSTTGHSASQQCFEMLGPDHIKIQTWFMFDEYAVRGLSVSFL